MDNTGLLAAAGSLAYFTIVKSAPLSMQHPIPVVTTIVCYAAVPYAYSRVVGAVAGYEKKAGVVLSAMDPSVTMFTMPLAGAAVAYGVARYLNI